MSSSKMRMASSLSARLFEQGQVAEIDPVRAPGGEGAGIVGRDGLEERDPGIVGHPQPAQFGGRLTTPVRAVCES